MNLPEGVLPLTLGTLLALTALSVVLLPLISANDIAEPLPVAKPKPKAGEGRAITALREIEFDKATGKLSDIDYEALRTAYTRDALAELRAADNLATPELIAATGPVTDDVVEAAIRRAKESTKSCLVCGPRPETDAVFCSNCSRYLAGSCRNCGTPVEAVGARFCTGCGEGLAAA